MRSSSKGGWLLVSVLLLSACSDDDSDGATDTASNGAGGAAAGSGATGNGAGGSSTGPSAGGGSVGGSGGSSGVGGGPVTGCATRGGPECPTGEMCCTGVPYPEEGACHRQCDMDSDSAIKDGFQSVDRGSVLERLATIDVTEWSYRRDGSAIRHMGPVAQDFREAFGLGTDGEHIHTVDGQGVTIAAVQALHDRVRQLQSDNEQLRRDQQALEARLRELERSR
jgi:hypothetical protein